MAVLVDGARLVEVDLGPRERLIELMDRFERPLCGYLQVILKDSDVVFDCAQDAFLRAYEHLERGKSINSQWLYKVARNRAIDHLRDSGRFAKDTGLLDKVPASDAISSQRETRARVVLDLLPLADRELLYLSIIDGFRTEDIGSMLGIRAGAVRVRLYRARERFRTLFGSMP